MSNIAEQVKAKFEAPDRGRKVTLQMLADPFKHVTSTGLGTKTYVFLDDGSHLKVRGRGRYFRLEAVEAGQQAA
jgi:hypothetical protein